MFRSNGNKKWFGMIVVIVLCLAVAGTTRAGWPQQDKLLALDGAAEDTFGESVSISGDYAIVGAMLDNDDGTWSGSAYIFKRDGTNWIQQAKLLASDGTEYNQFGCSVSIDGDYVIIGAQSADGDGAAYIFKRDGTTWTQQAKLLASDGASNDTFGHSVLISGDYAIVGAYGDQDNGSYTGSAYVFEKPIDGWVDANETVKLTASDASAWSCFGCSVSINENYAVVGAYRYDEPPARTGLTYIFRRIGTAWTETDKLAASDATAGDWFGRSVCIDGNQIIVGADHYNSGTGSAYIFEPNDIDPDKWEQQAKLTATDLVPNDQFGWSVSICGDTAVVGARLDGNFTEGSAFVFEKPAGGWVDATETAKLTAADGFTNDYFGHSVSISGNYAVIGAPEDDDNGDSSGSAYIFRRETGTPTLLAPNGGEELIADTMHTISWETEGTIDNILLEYSTDNGTDWTVIDTVANTGSYQWDVPQENSWQCLVRVSDAGCLSANDISDNTFRIYVCTLVSDLNHDCFVDFFDFSLLAAEWLRCGDPCDLDCQP